MQASRPPYHPDYPEYFTGNPSYLTTTHTSSSDSDTVPLEYDSEFAYAPGDGFIYFIASISGQSRLRLSGLTHMSEAWKEYVLTNYSYKRPDRRPRDPRQPYIVQIDREGNCRWSQSTGASSG